MPNLGRNTSQSCKKLCSVTQRFDETLLVQEKTIYSNTPVIFFFFIFQFLQALLFAPWPATNEEAMRLAEHLVSCKPNLATVLDNTSPSVKDGSLLATCFGNRSAVLYELGKLEVASSYKS